MIPGTSAIAAGVAGCFQRATRPDGSEYVKLTDDRPEWLWEAVRDAHGKDADGAPAMLPDDYRYRYAAEAVQHLADADDDDDLGDVAHEFAHEGVDVYTADLTAWLGSHATRPGYVDEATDYTGDATGITDRIALGQAEERREVFDVIAAAVEAVAELQDDDDDEQ